MPSVDSPVLIDLFTQLELCKHTKTKSELLGKAKYLIFNTMSNEQIIDFFGEKSNFENLFTLNVWTTSLEEATTTEFLEPYEIIEKVFSCFKSLLDLMNKFKKQIVFLIQQNQDEKVKHILVKHLIQLTKTLQPNDLQTNPSLVSDIKEVLPELVKQMSITSFCYSQLIADFVCELTHKVNYLENGEKNNDIIFSDQMVNELEKLSTQSSIIRFRIFELINKLATCSNEHLLNICATRFNLNKKLYEYLNDKHDVLSKLNCIEILADLAITQHGFDFLNRNGHLKTLYDDMNDENNIFLIPSIVKLFSVIARLIPERMNENYPGYFMFLFKQVSNEDVVKNHVSIKLALETFVYLMESNQLKEFFNLNYSNQFSLFFDNLTWLLKGTINDDLRINSLICIAELMSPDPKLLTQLYDTDIKWQESESASNPMLIEMAHSFYNRIVSKITHELLFNICLTMAKQPFFHTRLAAHFYFKALAQTKLGLALMFTANKYNQMFVDEYLLNRTTEIEKKGLESKYELIKLISANFTRNADLIDLVGENNLAKLKLYVRQGPFFSIAQSRVATENI